MLDIFLGDLHNPPPPLPSKIKWSTPHECGKGFFRDSRVISPFFPVIWEMANSFPREMRYFGKLFSVQTEINV